MTFSIVGLCPRTGQFGCALATSSMGAGGRAPFVGPGIGVVLSQARSDPRLGVIGLKSLEYGRSAPDALSDMIASTPHSAWRQLAVLDRSGAVASFTGAHCTAEKGAQNGHAAIAIGNGLASASVPGAMMRGYEAAPEKTLADRALAWLKDCRRAGIEVLSGDPKRTYFPKGAFDHLAAYQVPVSRELEDAEIKQTSVWRLRAD